MDTVPNDQPIIAIIGAGVAGITAATKLIGSGFKHVTVLEAENRIGGRVNTVNFEGINVDLGAQWIHGEEGNVVHEMVKDLDIASSDTVSSDYECFTFFSSNNAILNKNLADRLCQIAFEVFKDHSEDLDRNGSVEPYFLQRYYDQVKSEFGTGNEDISKLAKMVQEWFSKFLLSYDPADTLQNMSLRNLFEYRECPGKRLNWKNNGYTSFLDVLIANNSDLTRESFIEKHVLFKKEINKIIWNQNSSATQKVEIHCSDGSKYIADHVILTVSVGVLKSIHETLFKPRLPDYKINCVENIPLGKNHKIFLKFPKKWWPDDVKDFNFLWTDEDRINIGKEFPQPQHNGRSWLEDLFGFYTIDSDPTVLLGWFVGPMTDEVERLPDETVLNAAMFLLKKFVGQICDIIEPTGILRSKWCSNPHFLGTYTYISTNMNEKGAEREDLAKPLIVDGKEVVLFAGEATHPTYFSTVHGAVETGFREAGRLIEMYKKKEFHKLIIVGAGMAGLGAARKLVENRIYDFLLLEAQEQAGGRIRTIHVDDKPLDVGAQWMHGKNNPLYELAVANNLLSEEESEEGLGLYVRSNGEIADPLIVKKVAFRIGQMLEDCDKFLNSNDYPSSLSVFLNQSFSQYLDEQDDIEQIDIFKELYDWHIRFQVIDNSCRDLSKLSAKSWSEYVCLDDEAHANFKYGYHSLVQIILDSLPTGHIQYNSEVAIIRFTQDKQVEVVLKDSRRFVCDHLILTPSLGVLKEFDGLSNVLPKELMENIQSMGFAGICKIFLFYDDKWWGDSKGFQLLWKDNCDFSEKHSWLRYITGFDEVFNHETALMTWVGGDAVREVESLPTDDIAIQCTELLQKFLPNYSVPLPNKVIRTQWLSNRFVKGSYCHITPECDAPNSGIRTLGKPVIVDSVPRIVLAGEAIHPSHYSTTHGAFESGLDQAQLICDYISTSN